MILIRKAQYVLLGLLSVAIFYVTPYLMEINYFFSLFLIPLAIACLGISCNKLFMKEDELPKGAIFFLTVIATVVTAVFIYLQITQVTYIFERW